MISLVNVAFYQLLRESHLIPKARHQLNSSSWNLSSIFNNIEAVSFNRKRLLTTLLYRAPCCHVHGTRPVATGKLTSTHLSRALILSFRDRKIENSIFDEHVWDGGATNRPRGVHVSLLRKIPKTARNFRNFIKFYFPQKTCTQTDVDTYSETQMPSFQVFARFPKFSKF